MKSKIVDFLFVQSYQIWSENNVVLFRGTKVHKYKIILDFIMEVKYNSEFEKLHVDAFGNLFLDCKLLMVTHLDVSFQLKASVYI